MISLFRVVVVLAAVLAANAYAGVNCPAVAQSVAIGPTSGILQVDTGHGVHYLCRLDQSMNGVAPETCKAWYSMFLTSLASGAVVNQYYATNDSTICTQLGSWVTPSPFPYYVALTNN